MNPDAVDWAPDSEDVVTSIRRAALIIQLSGRAAPGEISEATACPGLAPLQQLAAQYGLLKPGTQGAT